MRHSRLMGWTLSLLIHAVVLVSPGFFVTPVGKREAERDFVPVELFELENSAVAVKEKRQTGKKTKRPSPQRVEKKVVEPAPAPPEKQAPAEKIKVSGQALEERPELEEKHSMEPGLTERPASETTPDDYTPPQQGVAVDEEVARFRRLVREKIEQAKFYPLAARKRGYEGVVGVAFRILEDGRVEDIKVTAPCRCEVLNVAACEVIRRASPFPRPPEHLGAEDLRMEVNIIFKLD